MGKAGARGEQQFPKIALARQNTFASLFEGLVVEREHRAIGVALRCRRAPADRAFGNRAVVGVQQAVLRPLDASKLFRLGAEFQSSADPHGGVGMEKIERALRADPEQQIEERYEGRRLAGFVWPIDDV